MLWQETLERQECPEKVREGHGTSTELSESSERALEADEHEEDD